MLNEIIKGKGFHISWNQLVGETALVYRESKFYILMGNYTQEYRPLVKKGYKACKKFFDDSVKKGAITSTWTD